MCTSFANQHNMIKKSLVEPTFRLMLSPLSMQTKKGKNKIPIQSEIYSKMIFKCCPHNFVNKQVRKKALAHAQF